MIQPWRCDICRANGSVLHRKGADVLEVYYMMARLHRVLSPDCTAKKGLARIKVPLEQP